MFQSTHPGWGATYQQRNANEPSRFQSTHPGWGATLPVVVKMIVVDSFNPRTPGGVRRDKL